MEEEEEEKFIISGNWRGKHPFGFCSGLSGPQANCYRMYEEGTAPTVGQVLR